MATVVAGQLKRVFDPKHPSRHPESALPLEPLQIGEVVFLVDGPLRIHGADYWQVAVDPYSAVLGWVPLLEDSGLPTLRPTSPTCPPVGELTATTLNSTGGLRALACFRDDELELRGEVECNRAIADGGIGGAGYFDSNRHCILDDALAVFGDAVTAIIDEDPSAMEVRGEYVLHGHFDDEEAHGCGWIPMGVSLSAPTTPEPGAVLFCRTNFVVTALELPES
jgi:hypothetical protein